MNIALAEAYYFGRDYDAAIEQAQRAIELAPDVALAHYNLGRAYEQKNLHEKALAEFQRARELAPNAATIVPLGYAYARMGQRERAHEALGQLEKLSHTQYVPAIYSAMIYTGMGDKDNAFQWLDKAVAEHCDYLIFLDHDPMADPLRGDPRFGALIKKISTHP